MMRAFVSLLFVVLAQAVVLGQQQDIASLDVDKLIQDHDAKLIAHTQQLIAAKTEAEREALSRTLPSAAELAPLMLRVAQEHPVETTSTKALVWLVTRASNVPEGFKGIQLLTEPRYASRAGLLDALDYLANSQPGVTEQALRAIATNNTHTEEKASATLGLGNVLVKVGEASPAGSPQRRAALDEAKKYFEEVLASYKDVVVRGMKVGDPAAAMLFELANVSEGCQAPEIDGKDAYGATFKLSDYRGMAVVVVFWGAWCHACHGTLAAIQADIQQLPPGKAVLVAVNTDPVDTLKQAIQDQHIECRNWSDGYNRGPISSVWNIHSWPCIFVIDAKGVIQRKNVPRPDVGKALREVLAMP